MRRIRNRAPLLVIIVLVVIAALLSACGSARTARQELPSFVYTSAASLEGYRVAVAMPELLEVLPCYCGCREPAGHRSLKDCFLKPEGGFDEHASSCDLCVKEAIDAATWHKQGRSPREIRALIDEKYQEFGKPTDTPPPH